jgi:hypothetical protein
MCRWVVGAQRADKDRHSRCSPYKLLAISEGAQPAAGSAVYGSRREKVPSASIQHADLLGLAVGTVIGIEYG